MFPPQHCADSAHASCWQHAGSGTHTPSLAQHDLLAGGGTDSASFLLSQQEIFLGTLSSIDLLVTSNGFRVAKLARDGMADSAATSCGEGAKSKWRLIRGQFWRSFDTDSGIKTGTRAWDKEKQTMFIKGRIAQQSHLIPSHVAIYTSSYNTIPHWAAKWNNYQHISSPV